MPGGLNGSEERRRTEVKAAILIGAVALVIGATAWHNNNMSISDIIGSKPVGLQCQIGGDQTSFFKGGTPYKPNKPPETWVIELNGSTWRMVTVDGQSWKEMVSQLAKSEGKQMDDRALNFPLRVTAEAYVLFEPEEKDDGKYKTLNRGLYIDRISGAVTGETSWGEKNGDFSQTTKTTGKCSPIDIKANL
jgi:hypothetical protein